MNFKCRRPKSLRPLSGESISNMETAGLSSRRRLFLALEYIFNASKGLKVDVLDVAEPLRRGEIKTGSETGWWGDILIGK